MQIILIYGTFFFKINIGTPIGMVVGFPLLSILCEIKLDNGWPWAFYVPGSIGVVWFSLWSLLISESPENHPYISEKERAYIMGSTGRKADATHSVFILT